MSNRLRMNTVNHLVRPDSAIVELTLMHNEGRINTIVRMKATHANSLWSEPHCPELCKLCSCIQ